MAELKLLATHERKLQLLDAALSSYGVQNCSASTLPFSIGCTSLLLSDSNVEATVFVAFILAHGFIKLNEARDCTELKRQQFHARQNRYCR